MSPALGSRLRRALTVGVVAAAVAGGAAVTGVLDGPERDLVDVRFQLRGDRPPPPDVLVVAIDEATIDRYGFPFRRSLHARAIRRLLRAGARSVAYDVQFSEPSTPREDRALLRAAADPRVILGTSETFTDGSPDVIGGVDRLRRSGGSVGQVLFPVDDDGVWRRFDGQVHGVPHLAVLAAGGDPAVRDRRIAFAGPPGTVEELSFLRVVDGDVLPRAVRGRAVVVGATVPELHDLHPTAAGGGPMPGPEIQANTIQTVLDDYPLQDAPPVLSVLLVLLAGLLAPLATLVGRPVRAVGQAFLAAAVGGALTVVGAQLLFAAGIVVPVAAALLALVLGTAGAVATTYVLEVRARQRLLTTFERFVAPDVAAQLLPDGGGAPRIASRRVEATVLFCDLRGFTRMAEDLDPDDVIAILNRYLGLVSEAVFAAGGTVASYQGDGVLAVFGAPIAQADHADRALRAARAIVDDGLPAFNAWLREAGLSDAPVSVGIGVNTGPVMSGLVGSDRRLEYAVVGDTTNVAARLQALGRTAPGSLFVAASTVAALRDGAPQLTVHDTVQLRGRREPLVVYTAAV